MFCPLLVISYTRSFKIPSHSLHRKLFYFLLNNTVEIPITIMKKKKNSSTQRDLYTQQKKEYLSVFPLVCPVYTWKALVAFLKKNLLAFLCLSCRILIEKTGTIHLLIQYVLHNGLGRNHTDAVYVSTSLLNQNISESFHQPNILSPILFDFHRNNSTIRQLAV